MESWKAKLSMPAPIAVLALESLDRIQRSSRCSCRSKGPGACEGGRPGERGKRPQRGREPGVEDVGILHERCAPALRAARRRIDHHRHVAVLASIHGHAMAEPQLAPDVPVAQPAKPVEVGPLVTLRM